jgi:hypothetical protein
VQVNIAFPIIFLAGCVFLVVMPMWAAPVDSAIGLGIMLTSVPVYYLFIMRQSRGVHALTGVGVPYSCVYGNYTHHLQTNSHNSFKNYCSYDSKTNPNETQSISIIQLVVHMMILMKALFLCLVALTRTRACSAHVRVCHGYLF